MTSLDTGTLNDALARFVGRLGPNAPYLALDDQEPLMRVAQSILAETQQIRAAANAITPALHTATAIGADQIQLAIDRGVTIGIGTPATSTGGVFSIPVAVGYATVIPITQVVSVYGDGIISAPINYLPLTPAIISAGSTSSAPISVQCTQVGKGGNVPAGAITQVGPSTIPGLSFTNTTAAAGGTDPDKPTTIQQNLYAAMQPRSSAQQIESAVLSLGQMGLYDIYVYDPALTDPTYSISGDHQGQIQYYWCDALGNQPGQGNTPTGLALAVQQKVLANVGAAIVAVSAAFTVVNITALAATYRAPVAVANSTIEPQIQAAIAGYIQGDAVNARSGGYHNKFVDSSEAFTACQIATGYTILSLAITSTTPAATAASNTTVYRLTGNPSSVIALMRVP